MFHGITKGEFESEKERNLYYKFFAGYFFNELIDGFEDRVALFYKLLQNPTFASPSTLPILVTPQPSKIFVSFDNHPDRYGTVQTGEFADMMILDRANETLIGIEVKFRDFWDYQKDIVNNGLKLQKVAPHLNVTHIIPCLLLTQKRWLHGHNLINHPGSNVKRLQSHPGDIIVLLWESFLPLVMDVKVKSYLSKQLEQIK